ncbi:O-GlcNAcase precursor [Poriferisphaera corsica]|uniref:beta-N-acetylhexosaminidase n=1 Tax=Poriferisphaera corsica TaxID=2528020 RepID=A0A517YTW8_9BACT|nr:glycoside hydrolase family 20 zincin-like fold domain-containing protein [Poriferisphaera corsica]QDU33680.1 O-GlcNAcase precursor [Poriferisphaera corsica]
MNLERRVVWSHVILPILAMACFFNVMSQAVAAEGEGWAIDFNQKSGLSVSYDGVPVIWKSSLYVVKPGWLGTLYGEGAHKTTIERLDSNGKQVVKAVGKSDAFTAEYTMTVVDARTVEITFSGKLTTNQACQAEFNMGYFNANLIGGKKYRGKKKDGSSFKGKVDVYPTKSGMWESDLVNGAKKYVFDSTLGELTIDFDAPQRVLFFDARNYTSGWSKVMPLFWGGYNVEPAGMKDAKNLKWSMRLTLDAHKQTTERKSYSGKLDGVQSEAVKGYAKTGELIVPKPKKMKQGHGTVILGDQVFCAIQRPEGDERLDRAVARTIAMFDGIELSETQWVKSADDSVVIRLSGKKLGKTAIAGQTSSRWYQNEEGYMLQATSDEVKIVSSTMRGAFFGLQSLKQLLRIDEQGLELPAIEVTDWPDMKFRGALFFPAKSGYEMDRKLIERVFAPLKMNVVVIEIDKIKWDTNPAMAYPDSMEKAQVRELVALARENFLEPMPLVNVPGHCGWLFNNDQNKDICEDWDAKYAVCTKNPKTFEVVFSIFDEAIEMFQPKIMHIGHDEVDAAGIFPNPACPQYSSDDKVAELFMDFMNKSASYLKERGIRSMVWSDMMLFKGESPDATNAESQEEADYCRENLPENVIIGDWHYAAAKKYQSQWIFKETGADTVGCVWATPANIYQMAMDVKAAGNLGQLQTMWCGFFPNEATIKAAFNQFAGHVLTAEYAWGNRKEKPSELPYTQGDVFNQLYAPKAVEVKGGKLIDMSQVGNVSRATWPMAGTGYNLSVLPDDVVNMKGYSFDMRGKKLLMIGNSSATSAKAYEDVTFDLGGVAAKEIALLNAGASNVMPGTEIAKMTVVFEDGNEVVYPLMSDVNTSGLIAGKTSTTLNAGWMGKGGEGGRMVLFISSWVNEMPSKKVKSIKFAPSSKQVGWILAGMTIVE